MTKKEVQKLMKSDYGEFEAVMDGADNVVDVFVEVEDVVNNETAKLRGEKKEIDSGIKSLKTVGETLRAYLFKYVESKGVERFDGVKAKSITYQPAKEVVETKSTRQIMVGRKYADIDSISKEDLIEMLESKGVKTRVISEEYKTTKEASIRVLR